MRKQFWLSVPNGIHDVVLLKAISCHSYLVLLAIDANIDSRVLVVVVGITPIGRA
jgi:hypothetical protein